MTGRDRTAEFIATVNSKREKPQWIQQRRGINGGYEGQPVNKLAVDPQYRNNMRISKECLHRLRDCFEKLERFTVLARKRTVFDDGESTRLIEEIRSDIGLSKSQLDELQLDAPKQTHSANLFSTLQQRLANVTSNFKSSLELRSKSVQQQTARHEMFAGPSTSSNLSLIQANNDNYNHKGPVLLDMNHSVPQYQQNHPQQQQQQQQMLLMNDQIDMSERADVMHSIESTIVELGTVFNQLAHMVQAQGETITRIDMNISETTGNVEAAHDALLGYFASINSNRWLILKVFMVLFFFFVMFVIFGT